MRGQTRYGALELEIDGCDAGPLFAPERKTRLPKPPRGKEGMVHRAQTRRATPPWADMAAIKVIYREAQRLSRETGELHVVDHIVPKISPYVCGLHVPANLRVIHWRENCAKANLWWPGMWNEQGELL